METGVLGNLIFTENGKNTSEKTRYPTALTIDRFCHVKMRDGSWTRRTEDFYKTHLNRWKAAAPMYLDEITLEHILDYIADVGKGRKGKTAPFMKKASFTCIKIFLNWCADEGQEYIIKSPIPRKYKLGKMPDKKRQIPTLDDLAVILDYWKRQGNYFPAVRNYCILRCFASTGCRLSELLQDKHNDDGEGGIRHGVRDFDIDWENRTIKVFGKGRKERIVYPDEKTFLSMEKYRHMVYKRWPVKKTTVFFLTEEGKPLQGAAFRQAFNRVCDLFNFPFTPHDWRRFFCTGIANSNINTELGMELTGHSSHDQYRHYIQIASSKVREAIMTHSPIAGL